MQLNWGLELSQLSPHFAKFKVKWWSGAGVKGRDRTQLSPALRNCVNWKVTLPLQMEFNEYNTLQ